MTTIQFRVPGMTCGHCEAAVTKELSALPGVTHVSVDLDTKAVVLATSDDFDLDWDVLTAAVDEAGFDLER